MRKDIIKGIAERPEEEVHRAGSRRVLSREAGVPVQLGTLGMCQPAGTGMGLLTRQLSGHQSLGNFVEAALHKHS